MHPARSRCRRLAATEPQCETVIRIGGALAGELLRVSVERGEFEYGTWTFAGRMLEGSRIIPERDPGRPVSFPLESLYDWHINGEDGRGSARRTVASWWKEARDATGRRIRSRNRSLPVETDILWPPENSLPTPCRFD